MRGFVVLAVLVLSLLAAKYSLSPAPPPIVYQHDPIDDIPLTDTFVDEQGATWTVHFRSPEYARFLRERIAAGRSEADAVHDWFTAGNGGKL